MITKNKGIVLDWKIVYSSYSLQFSHSLKEIEAAQSRGIYMWPENDVIKKFFAHLNALKNDD